MGQQHSADFNFTPVVRKTAYLDLLHIPLAHFEPSQPSFPAHQLWAESPCIVYCLRRPGCILCRMGATDLAQYREFITKKLGIRMVALFHERSRGIEEFKNEYWKGEVYIDVDKKFFKAMGGGKLNWQGAWGLMNKESRTDFMKAKERGITGNLSGEGRILGGLLIVSPKPTPHIPYQYQETRFGDYAPTATVLQQCIFASKMGGIIDNPIQNPIDLTKTNEDGYGPINGEMAKDVVDKELDKLYRKLRRMDIRMGVPPPDPSNADIVDPSIAGINSKTLQDSENPNFLAYDPESNSGSELSSGSNSQTSSSSNVDMSIPTRTDSIKYSNSQSNFTTVNPSFSTFPKPPVQFDSNSSLFHQKSLTLDSPSSQQNQPNTRTSSLSSSSVAPVPPSWNKPFVFKPPPPSTVVDGSSSTTNATSNSSTSIPIESAFIPKKP
ncbi:hypothetical protein BKA69DRAFT_1103351 [Paraphysoderma sedebokerense]|nr:hypothetical protein BKA69DRAFT_1103351 [Paraphysoderma sedebokerense]